MGAIGDASNSDDGPGSGVGIEYESSMGSLEGGAASRGIVTGGSRA